MKLVNTPDDVLATVERMKKGAADFRTNFFFDKRKLQLWVDRQELSVEEFEGCAFFLRADRDFFHLYFSAADTTALAGSLKVSEALAAKPLVADVLQNRGVPADWASIFGAAGFRSYSRLQRMLRLSATGGPDSSPGEAGVSYALPSDLPRVLELLERSFDRYANQLPSPGELESAITAEQVLVARCGERIAALLFFETQGLTSSVRFWLVAEDFRGQRYGSTLMRHYLNIQNRVRRFILWVLSDNADAIRKYNHYGYAPDGLIDQLFVNGMIRL